MQAQPIAALRHRGKGQSRQASQGKGLRNIYEHVSALPTRDPSPEDGKCLAGAKRAGHVWLARTARIQPPFQWARLSARLIHMFTIEHDFDATIITLIDEGTPSLREDITIRATDDRVSVAQFDTSAQTEAVVTLSLSQLRDLAAALDLPEGSYRLVRKTS